MNNIQNIDPFQSSETSFLQTVRNSYHWIEFIEILVIGGGLGVLFALILATSPTETEGSSSFFTVIMSLILPVGALLINWLVYRLYMFISERGGKIVDILLWIGAAALTTSFTFWSWTVMDINRWIVAKLFYRGPAPVAYAWSYNSKLRRKMWNQARKQGVSFVHTNGFNCAVCGAELPQIRKPANSRQAMWGGWTCPKCGSELDRNGNLISQQVIQP